MTEMYDADKILHLKKIHEAILESSGNASSQTKELLEQLGATLKEQTDTLSKAQADASKNICESIRNLEQTLFERFNAIDKSIGDLKSSTDNIKSTLDSIASRTPTQQQLAKMHLYSNIVEKYKDANTSDRNSWQSIINTIANLCTS